MSLLVEDWETSVRETWEGQSLEGRMAWLANVGAKTSYADFDWDNIPLSVRIDLICEYEESLRLRNWEE